MSKFESFKENLGITDLENYLKDYKVKKLNEIISQNFNAEIDFNNIFMNDYSDINYGQIPTIEELSNSITELFSRSDNELSFKIENGLVDISARIDETVASNLEQYKTKIEALFDNIVKKNDAK